MRRLRPWSSGSRDQAGVGSGRDLADRKVTRKESNDGRKPERGRAPASGRARRPSTRYLWGLPWRLPSIALPVGMLAALAVTAFGAGINVAGDLGRVDPTKVAEHALFKEPGVVEIAPGQYEVRLTAQIWSFAPNEIRVPAGATVHFWATSKDIEHGLLVPRHNVNVMLLPGQISPAP